MAIEMWILGCLVVLLAALTMSITGFGFALIAAPLFLFILEPKTVVIVNLVVGSMICILILWQSRRQVELRGILFLCICSVFGIPVGILILSQVADATLKLVIGAIVVISAIPLALGHSHRFRKEDLGSCISGFLGGTFMSSTSLAGPLVVLFLLNQGWGKDTFRASLAAYFLFCNAMALTALGLSGILTREILVIASSYVPISLFGFYLGIKILPHVNANVFRRIAIFIVIGAGVLAVATNFPQLL